MRRRYATVRIPSELTTKLDDLLSDLGYRSRAEVVNDAIRRYIDEGVLIDKSVQRGIVRTPLILTRNRLEA